MNMTKKKGYDVENMPELSQEQLALFKRVSPDRYNQVSAIDTVRILKKDKVLKVKKLGRPKKSPEEKENIVAIRLSKAFIKRLKKRAGKTGWQTYAKKILEDHLSNKA